MTAARTGDAIRLSWSRPIQSKELKGYRVYRSSTSGSGFTPISSELLSTGTFIDSPYPDVYGTHGALYYTVTAVEHSGLESGFSNEVCADYNGTGKWESPVRHQYEAERGTLSPSARAYLDGDASNGYFVLGTAEDASTVELAVNPPRDGVYRAWCRQARRPCPGLASSQHLPKPDPNAPHIDRRDCRHHNCCNHGFFSLRLSWSPSPSSCIAFYRVYRGSKEAFNCDYETLRATVRGTEFADSDLKPDSFRYQATDFFYRVSAVDSNGLESEPTRAVKGCMKGESPHVDWEWGGPKSHLAILNVSPYRSGAEG